MLPLRCLTFLLVKGSDALFEAKEGLVDFGSFSLSVLIVALAILGPFTSCQINKQQLTAWLHSFLLNLDLSNRMTPTGRIIRLGGMSCPHSIALFNEFQDMIIVVYKLLLQAWDLNHTVFIFSKVKRKMIVKEIIEFSAIYFIHTYGNRKVSLMVFPIINSSLKEVLDGNIL